LVGELWKDDACDSESRAGNEERVIAATRQGLWNIDIFIRAIPKLVG
jgi:hypothetical protein